MVLKEETEFAFSGKQKYSVREKIVAVSGTTKISVQNRHQNPKESQRPNEVHLGSLLVNRADITSKVSARDHLVIMGIQPNVNSTKQNRDAHLVKSARKKPKGDGDNNAVALLKDSRQLGCVFQDTEPPESSSFYGRQRKSWNQFDEWTSQKLRHRSE